MAETDVEIDALIAELASLTTDHQDAEYPLPEQKPVKYTNVDVVVMPPGYKSKYPKPEDSLPRPRAVDSLPSMKLDLDAAEEVDGVLSVPAIVAKQMVYDYDGLKVLKPFDELKAAALFANGIPLTKEHPKSGIVTDRAEVLGFLRNPVAENDMLKGILEITDKDLVADVKEKKLTEVSAGFFCDLDFSDSGDFNGEHYDATQKKIFLNHVAVVEKGRCSIEDGCGIGLDAKVPLPQELVDKITAAIERAKAMKDKSLLDMLKALLKGVTVKKDSQEKTDANALDLVKLKDAFSALKAERDSLKVKLEEIVKAEKDSLIAELESMQHSKKKDDLEKMGLDDLQKELDMVKELRSNRLTVQGERSSGRKGIDEAYGKIGGK